MFDIGFWELALIAVVGLLVIGPDKLPGVARTTGMWVGRFRRFVTQVRDDVDRELRQEELKKALENDAGLEEIKQIMNTDDILIEEEETPAYQVKAIPDEESEASGVSGSEQTAQKVVDTPAAEAETPHDGAK